MRRACDGVTVRESGAVYGWRKGEDGAGKPQRISPQKNRDRTPPDLWHRACGLSLALRHHELVEQRTVHDDEQDVWLAISLAG